MQGHLTHIPWLHCCTLGGALRQLPLVDMILPMQSAASFKFGSSVNKVSFAGIWQPGLMDVLLPHFTLIDVVLASLHIPPNGAGSAKSQKLKTSASIWDHLAHEKESILGDWRGESSIF